MKKLLFSFLVLGLMAVSGFAQKSGGIATAKIQEADTDMYSRILLVYENGAKEVISLKPIIGSSRDWEARQNTSDDNQVTITKMLNTMNEKGYDVIETTSNQQNAVHFQLFVTFRKRE